MPCLYSSFVASDGFEIRFRRCNGRSAVGNGQPPVILLHGFADSGEIFACQWRALCCHRFAVVAPDQRGFGASARSQKNSAAGAPVDFSLDRAARDVVELMDALGLATASLVGFSFGGLLALNVAAAHPQRVARMVLLSASPQFKSVPGWPLGNPQWYSDASAAAVHSGDMRALGQALARIATTDLCGDEDGSLARTVVATAMLADPAAALGAVESAGDPVQGNARPLLPLVRAPTLVAFGSDDAVVSPAVALYLRSALPNASIAEVRGGGHFFLRTHARQTSRLLLDFLLFPDGSETCDACRPDSSSHRCASLRSA